MVPITFPGKLIYPHHQPTTEQGRNIFEAISINISIFLLSISYFIHFSK